MHTAQFLMQFCKQAAYLLLQILSFIYIHLGQANSQWQTVQRKSTEELNVVIAPNSLLPTWFQLIMAKSSICLCPPTISGNLELEPNCVLCVRTCVLCVYVCQSPWLNDRFLFSLFYLLFPFSSWQPSLSAEYCYHFFILILSLAAYIITLLFQDLDTYPLIH